VGCAIAAGAVVGAGADCDWLSGDEAAGGVALGPQPLPNNAMTKVQTHATNWRVYVNEKRDMFSSLFVFRFLWLCSSWKQNSPLTIRLNRQRADNPRGKTAKNCQNGLWVDSHVNLCRNKTAHG
jgi:hypothetical protein